MSKSLFAALTEGASDPSGVRRTALFLHGLHPADRDLLLQGVAVEQREHLVVLLQELNDLGIDATQTPAGLLSSPVATGEAFGPGSEASRDDGHQAATPSPTAVEQVWVPTFSVETDADWLYRADARVVGEVLVAEPDLLVARVLRLNAWPWQSRVLNLFDPGRRARIDALLLDPIERRKEHARLDTALLCQLRRAVAHRSAISSPEVEEAPGLHRRWSTRMLSVLRRRGVARRSA